MLADTEQLSIHFEAGEPGRARLMWSQVAMWEVLNWLPSGQEASLNLRLVCEAPAGTTVEAVIAAVRALVERHDSLHTLVEVEDGIPYQVRLPRGSIEVVLRDGGPAEPAAEAEQLWAELAARAFSTAEDMPIRAGIVLRDRAPAYVVLAISHFAADGWSLRIIGKDLHRLLAGEDLGPRAQQPLERAEYEMSGVAQRRQRRALDHWERCVRHSSATWLTDLRRSGPADLAWAEMDSPALAAAVRELAAAHRMTTGMVLQTLVALTLAVEHDERDVALRGIVATRFRRETLELVGAFNLNALFHLELADEPQSVFFARARQAALLALGNCEADPELMADVVTTTAAERGIDAGGFCFYNDVRPTAEPAPMSVDGARESIGDLLADTTITAKDHDGVQKGSKFFLFVNAVVDVVRLSLCADRRFVAADRFLRDLEWVGVTMFRGGHGPEQLRRAFAGRPDAEAGTALPA